MNKLYSNFPSEINKRNERVAISSTPSGRNWFYDYYRGRKKPNNTFIGGLIIGASIMTLISVAINLITK